MQQQLTRLRGAWAGIPQRAQYAVIGVAVVTVLVMFLVLRASTSTEWEPVATELSQAQVGEAQTALDEAGIDNRVTEAGGGIEVPKSDAPKAASALIPAGIATKSSRADCAATTESGNSLIAKTSAEFDMMQETCTESQAANAIEGVEGIEHAEVDVTLPDATLFAEDESEPKASVTLETDGVGGLANKAVQGIQLNVANRFDGLKPENVVVTDQTGRVLGGSEDDEEGGRMEKLQAEAAMNKKIEKDLTATFASIVGEGNVVVGSNIELDMDKIDRNVADYSAAGEDGEPLPEVEEYAKELLNGTSDTAVQGVAGTGTNEGVDPDNRTVTPDTTGGTDGDGDYVSDKASTKYANNSVEEAIKVAPGAVIRNRLTVVVDDDVDPAAANAVKNAVQAWMGGNAQDSLAFDQAPLAVAQPVKASDGSARAGAVQKYLKYGLLGLGLIGLAFVLRRTLTQRTAELLAPADDLLLLDSGEFTPIPIAELEAALAANQPSAERRSRLEMQRKVEQIADSKPHDVANELRRWMHSDEQGYVTPRKAG
jgi:flagellar M-ring protein FliF